MISEIINLLSDKEYMLNEYLSSHTTFNIGGKADIFVVPDSAEKMIQILDLCKKNNIDYFILGKGSNILVSDAGYRGCIISTENLDFIKIVEDYPDHCIVEVGAGVGVKELAEFTKENSLGGFEFACGIPGSVGGGVFMNAGAYGGEFKDVVLSVTAYDENKGICILRNEEIGFRYRHTNIEDNNNIVFSVKFIFKKSDKRLIEEYMKDLTDKRNDKQPLEYPSAGSTFKRPEGYFAGKLIIDAGLVGKSIGGAQVSTKHAGFIINKGDASADDVYKLILHIQNEVRDKFGVSLEREVRLLGEF